MKETEVSGYNLYALAQILFEIMTACSTMQREILILMLFLGFVSGLKLMLPENAIRKDNKEYEEVIIPKNDPPPLQIGNKRVPICDLDEVNIFSKSFLFIQVKLK